MNTGLTTNNVQALAVSGTSVFAGTNGGGIFMSANNGKAWTEINTGLSTNDVKSMAANESNLFSGMHNGGAFTLVIKAH